MEDKNLTIEAYVILFEIETTLTDFIYEILLDEYNYKVHTLLPRPLQNSFFHDKISYLRKFNCLSSLFTPKDILIFEKCIPVRNRICHMKTINLHEYKTLLSALSILTSVISKRNIVNAI